MKFSREQKEILKMIFNLTQMGQHQPKPILFETIITAFTPENCFVNFSKSIEGFRIVIYNNEIKNQDQIDIINGKILTYLFLIDQLVKDNYIIIYKLKNGLDYRSVFLNDRTGKEINFADNSEKFISQPLYSPTFWEIIEKYGNTVIQPSFSLIQFIENGFKTDSEKATEDSLRKTGTGLKYSAIAVIISLFAFIGSICVGLMELKINKRVEQISVESLEFSKKSATETKQIEIINHLDSISDKMNNIKKRK